MRYSAVSLFAVATMILAAAPAWAQDAAQPELLPESVAEGERAEDSYGIGTGNESGTSRVQRKEIEARTPGSGDVNQLLKLFPTVQFNRDEGIATRENIQDLRPAEISISGGRVYDNLITIDGIDANSRLDISNSNPFDLDDPAGAAPQTIWLDSDLIGSITLRDSNVSAEYGRFTGGALDIQTREARRRWGASAHVNHSEDALVNYIISRGTREAYETSGDPLPDPPEFRKWRFGATIDVPISDRGGLLVAANRSVADVLYFRSAGYAFEPGFRRSLSDNFLLSGNYDLAPDLELSGRISYSPYESEAANQNGIDNLVTSKGGGVAGRLRLARSGDLWWDVTATFAHNDTSRTAPPANYSLPSNTTNGAVCSNTNCTIGGFGNVDQFQDTYGLTARIGRDVGAGQLRGGLDLQRIEALRRRPETNFAYSRAITGSNIVCVDDEDLGCATGEYAVGQYSEYRAYTADVDIDSIGLWAEYDASLGAFDLRAGLRYDHESFLGNHDFAPRLALTFNAAPGWTLTAGANRYFGRSMLAYALREQAPDNFTYRRNGTLVGGVRRISDADWFLYSTSVSIGYSGSDLETPYSDELTAAIGAPLLGGTARLKGIYRWGKDEFARSLRKEETYVLADGTETTRRFYEMTNDGRSEYGGLSLEWVRNFGKHSLAFNANYSETRTNNSDYLETAFELEEEGQLVLYNGQVIELIELLNQNQRLNYASPFLVNASWTALWFDDRLTTNVNLRYRDGFDQIEDTGVNETVDGVRYDVYDITRYSGHINVDLNAQLDLLRGSPGTLTADVRVANLLDKVPSKDSVSISQPYQYGRSFWFGLKFQY